MPRYSVTRRDFLKSTATVTGAAAVGSFAGSLRPAHAAGKPVEEKLLITSTAKFDPVRPETARLVVQGFKEIGWQTTMNPMEYNQGIQKVIMEHEYDMFLVRLTGQALRIDPDVFIYQTHHKTENKSGGWNWTGYNNPKVNELCIAQQRAMDIDERQQIVYEAQKLIHEDVPESALVYPAMTNAYRTDRLKNLVPMMGEGIGSFWTDINAEVIGGDGFMRTGATVNLKNLNPIATTDANEFKELRLIYDYLVRIGPDGKWRPWAAKEVKVVNDTTIDVTIRDGMKFHDSVPVTAEDIKFTFEYAKEWKAPFFQSSLERIENIEITGKNALRFKLTDPHAPLISNLFGSLFILPKHVWEKIPDEADVDDPLKHPNDNPVGSGPFKFEYWDRGAELKLSAFKEHFSAPKCAGILRITYGSHDAMAAAIERGECDRTRYILKPSLMEDLNNVENVVGKGYPSHGFYALSFNTRKPPFNDPAFRLALDHVVPKQLIRDIVLSGHASIGGSVIAPVNEFWHNPEVKPHPNDAEKARKILANAGYSWDEQGRLLYPA